MATVGVEAEVMGEWDKGTAAKGTAASVAVVKVVNVVAKEEVVTVMDKVLVEERARKDTIASISSVCLTITTRFNAKSRFSQMVSRR
ncbi:MAG: hypothetical protein EP343_03425 [Deltaproteobacteria bacterium]|nr:MAG: hypothetical protein EP343_03425 [Deltaproteobacteria bacterium]